MYYDKNGKVIGIGDILYFEKLGFFEVCFEKYYLLKKYNDDCFPRLLLNKIILGNHIESAYIVDKYWIMKNSMVKYLWGGDYVYIWQQYCDSVLCCIKRTI